ncbi:MAG: PAS domain-containing sensor histidine kinase [Myxococcota bacterium]|nr:PAS domain-containing sensor histidine kinase [Myxococcota bacterium]
MATAHSTEQIGTDAWDGFDVTHRLSKDEIDASVQALADHPMVNAILDAANVSMVVVNPQLQIVAANQAILATLGESDASAIIGKRLGEAICCINADAAETGCASGNCSQCGATGSVLESFQSGRIVLGECLIETQKTNRRKVTEYSIKATPVIISGEAFCVVALQDISDGKRRQALERVFIHDLSNILTGLIGWSEDLAEFSTGDLKTAASSIEILAWRLAQEVKYYKILIEVESHVFKPDFKTVYPIEAIETLQVLFQRHDATQDKTLKTIQPIPSTGFKTDPFLLERVLINMVKNAFEETPVGGAVEIGCTMTKEAVRFTVWNETPIPKKVASRIFERSFSTKSGSGRGLGTYSMKLFGEDVLGGTVSFTSSNKAGTTFYIELPIRDQPMP